MSSGLLILLMAGAEAPPPVAWVQAPSAADVAAAYPSKARESGTSGEAGLDCVVAGDGTLTRCIRADESPEGQGFGAAALTLTPKFKAMSATGRRIAGSHVRVPFRFEAAVLAEPAIVRPEWAATPAPKDFQAAFPAAASQAGVLRAKAVMSCVVDASGGLKDCASVSEDPAGYGFGAATLPLAAGFRLKLWGADGRPVAGARIRLPIRYELQQAPIPAPSKSD